jgi:undecaprenyl-diphosphatase
VTALQALFLGILQGLGEFLPISSSGHLIVVPWMLGWPAQSLSFDVALHIGTLLAVVYAFRGEWWALARGLYAGARAGRLREAPEARLLGQLVLASVPAAVIGLLLDDWADTTFRSPRLVASTMAVMGVVLMIADRRAPPSDAPSSLVPYISHPHAILIGLAQSLALVPGVSRSGATISMALLLGHPRPEAARFSFLLATPITFGAALKKVPELYPSADPYLVLIGMTASAVVGFLSIRVLLAYVRTRDYRPFVYYRFAFAALTFVMLWMRSGDR